MGHSQAQMNATTQSNKRQSIPLMKMDQLEPTKPRPFNSNRDYSRLVHFPSSKYGHKSSHLVMKASNNIS